MKGFDSRIFRSRELPICTSLMVAKTHEGSTSMWSLPKMIFIEWTDCLVTQVQFNSSFNLNQSELLATRDGIRHEHRAMQFN